MDLYQPDDPNSIEAKAEGLKIIADSFGVRVIYDPVTNEIYVEDKEGYAAPLYPKEV